jgi:uncharacterized GH25 family protein
MKIVKKKQTNIVIFADNSLVLNENGLQCNKFTAKWCKPNFHILEEVQSLPFDYRGNHYTYEDGTWAKTPYGIAQDAISQEEAEKIAAAEQIETENKINLNNDVLLSAIKNKSFAEIEAYINNNVTNIASSKTVLKGLAKAVLWLIKKEVKNGF